MDRLGWKELFPFNDKELSDLENAKKALPQTSFITEKLQNGGFEIIPLDWADYPVVLKENLKIKSSPPVLYIKGRKGLLKEEAVAIVGSRKAGQRALDFTDLVAKKNVQEFKVIVSGFAKGVDKEGNPVEKVQKKVKQEYLFDQLSETAVGDSVAEYTSEKTPEEKILELLGKGSYTAKEIIAELKIDWSSNKIAAFLKKNPDVRIEKGKVSKYTMQENETPTLFG